MLFGMSKFKPTWRRIMKIKCLIISLFIFFLFCTTAWAEPESPAFQDIQGSFAEDAILQLTSQGIMNGISPEEFAPSQNISRKHFAVLTAKVLGVQPYYPTAPTFSDMPLGSAETGYVEALAKLGLITGTGNKVMGADNPVTRQDAAILLHRALAEKKELPSIAGKYLDQDRISPYAAESVAYVTEKGLMKGSDNCFNPQAELTRAEASVLADRLLKIRKGQALTAFPVVSSQKLQIKTGETRKVEPDNPQQPLPFTPIYGLDDPGAGSISPSGIFSAGKQPGTVTITVNAGYNAYTINTDIATSSIVEKTTGENSVTAATYFPEEELTGAATYSVLQYAPDKGFSETEKKSYPGPADGLSSKSDTWTGFFRQGGRDITVDLKQARPVTKISFEFKQEAESGIYFPKNMDCSVSMDGKEWYHLGQVSHSIAPSDTTVLYKNFTLTFPPVTARYVKLSFPVDIFVFARHLSIKGGSPPEKPAVLAHDERATKTADTYLQIPDMKNILLVFTGGHGDLGNWTSEDFLPMLAYVDNKYSIKGKLFDTMLFLPYPELACTRDGWAAYADNLFTPGAQLFALDEVMARLNKIPDYQGKVNVILTIPYPDGQQQDFGALEKGGTSLSFSDKSVGQDQAAKNRFLAVRWYYDNLMARWSQAGFKNLNLAGIYWYRENMDSTTPGDIELVQNVARLVRNNGQQFFWIPFFGAQGYDNWRSFGFNHAFLQPNYYADKGPPDERMDKAAELAKRYNLGLEIECDDGILYNRSYYDLFYKQLDKAHQLNIDQAASKAYYAGSKTLVRAWRSNNYKIRTIYDDLYRWINGTYKPTAKP